MKLSKIQISALQSVPLYFGQSEVNLNKHYWSGDKGVDFSEKTVDALIGHGLLEKRKNVSNLTEKGKKILEENLIGRIQIGYVVRLKNGKVGMITWYKNNYEIGVNISHYHLVMSMSSYKGKTEDEKRDMIIALGADDAFDKTDIVEVIRDNSIYTRKWKI